MYEYSTTMQHFIQIKTYLELLNVPAPKIALANAIAKLKIAKLCGFSILDKI